MTEKSQTALFTALETWYGGFYELAVELGSPSDERMQAALDVIWAFDGVEGCYEKRDVEPTEQPRVLPTLSAQSHGHLLGIAALPGGVEVACGTFVVREDGGPDRFIFYLPVGALSTAYDIGAYPVDDKSTRGWRVALDEWMARLASAIYKAVPFALALIGHEVSGDVSAQQIAQEGVPVDRWIGYLTPNGDGVAWYPPTQHGVEFGVE